MKPGTCGEGCAAGPDRVHAFPFDFGECSCLNCDGDEDHHEPATVVVFFGSSDSWESIIDAHLVCERCASNGPNVARLDELHELLALGITRMKGAKL